MNQCPPDKLKQDCSPLGQYSLQILGCDYCDIGEYNNKFTVVHTQLCPLMNLNQSQLIESPIETLLHSKKFKVHNPWWECSESLGVTDGPLHVLHPLIILAVRGNLQQTKEVDYQKRIQSTSFLGIVKFLSIVKR